MTLFGPKSISVRKRGFTLIEMTVVIIIISALAAVALDRYYKLLIDVERTSMEHDLGVMRSAIGIQVAGHYVAGDMAGLEELVGGNPMDFLVEKPKNYLGVKGLHELGEMEKGSWIYDPQAEILVYLVRNRMYFKSRLEEPERARFKILPVYSEKRKEDVITKYLSGLRLQPVEPYRWLRPWE